MPLFRVTLRLGLHMLMQRNGRSAQKRECYLKREWRESRGDCVVLCLQQGMVCSIATWTLTGYTILFGE